MARQSLTIHLIKEHYSENEKCIRADALLSLDNYVVDIEGASYACLYLRKNKPREPDWSKLFHDIKWWKYATNTFSGLLIVDVSERRFAITSGAGRYLLNPFATEESFGFKTVINSVDPSAIRKIEKKTINQNPINSIDQVTGISGLLVKKYGSSGVLSHLFNQGRVAARLFLEDRQFREEAHKKFNNSAPFKIEDRPEPWLFTISFLIGSKYGDNQPLPLFSRVVLVDVFNELRNYGFNVTMGFIKIDMM